MKRLRIGELAEAAGVPVQTVRYYERRGICVPEARTTAGYRIYTEATVARLKFIRQAQQLGFSLREIEELLDLRLHETDACAAVEHRVEEKIGLVSHKIRELTRLRRTLERLAQACLSREVTGECPVLEFLEHHEEE